MTDGEIPSNANEKEFHEYFIRLENWTNEFKNYFQNAALSNIAFTTNTSSVHSGGRNQQNRGRPASPMGEVYEVLAAPLWKRFLAEFIDGLILFFIKSYIIIILHDGFDISWKNYLNYVENANFFLNFNPEIAIVEFSSRLVIFTYESYFLSVEYATPGKRVLGLKVVVVEAFVEAPGRPTLFASPCVRPGWWRAFFRSVLKSLGVFVLSFIYEMCANAPHCGHDYVTKTMVIDISRFPMRLANGPMNPPNAQRPA